MAVCDKHFTSDQQILSWANLERVVTCIRRNNTGLALGMQGDGEIET